MNIIPFSPRPLAERKSAPGLNAALMEGVSAGGFPVISIKGKVFNVVRDGERTMITKPGEEGPASYIDVVIVAANRHPSRVYYANGYQEGANEKPTCYSNDGQKPAADAQSPQAKSCAVCPHAQYGSKVSESGVKGWACANSRRLAVAPSGNLDDIMLLRVPGASLKTLAQYARELDGYGYAFDEVVTRIGFDYSVAYPALTFKPIGVLPDDTLEKVRAAAKTPLVDQIIGVVDSPFVSDEYVNTDSRPVDTVVAKAEARPVAVNVPVEDEKSAPQVEEKAPKRGKAKTVRVVEDSDVDAELDALLDDLSFDD